jgi:hypothetical protein
MNPPVVFVLLTVLYFHWFASCTDNHRNDMSLFDLVVVPLALGAVSLMSVLLLGIVTTAAMVPADES